MAGHLFVQDRRQVGFVEFGGRTGAESYGIVDIVAIRKNHRPSDPDVKRGDLFEIILIQAKGGSAPWPSESDIDRLDATAKFHRARAVVLASWKLGTKVQLYQLVDRTWQERAPLEVFARTCLAAFLLTSRALTLRSAGRAGT